MDLKEIQDKLKANGHQLGRSVVNTDGKICLLVDGVFMFQPDAADLCRGYATIDQIVTRNAGKNIPAV